MQEKRQAFLVPAATFRRHLCAGKPLTLAERWYPATGITALNMLVGFRLASCVWDSVRPTAAPQKHNPALAAT